MNGGSRSRWTDFALGIVLALILAVVVVLAVFYAEGLRGG